MLDIRASSIKLGGAHTGSLRVLRSGTGRIRAAWPPGNQLRPGPERNARRTHPWRRQSPPRGLRRATLGHDDSIPSLYLPDPSREPLLEGSTMAGTPGHRGRIRPYALGGSYPSSLHREPPRLPELEVQPGLPDYPALAVRSRLHEAHMPLAARTSSPHRHSDPLRTNKLDREEQPQVETALSPAEPHLPGHSGGNGQPVVTLSTPENEHA